MERLARVAALQPEMAQHERQLDSYFELLKTNHLDENTSLVPIEKAINYFQVRAYMLLCHKCIVKYT